MKLKCPFRLELAATHQLRMEEAEELAKEVREMNLVEVEFFHLFELMAGLGDVWSTGVWSTTLRSTTIWSTKLGPRFLVHDYLYNLTLVHEKMV